MTLDELAVGVNNLIESGEMERQWEKGYKKYLKDEPKERDQIWYWFARAICENMLDNRKLAMRSLNNALNLTPKTRQDIETQQWILIYVHGKEYHIRKCNVIKCRICNVLKEKKK